MAKLTITLNIDVDADVIIENLKRYGVIKDDGTIIEYQMLDYLKGYINGAGTVAMDTTDVLQPLIAEINKKLGINTLH